MSDTKDKEENITYEVKYHIQPPIISSLIHFGHFLMGPFIFIIFYFTFPHNLYKNMGFSLTYSYLIIEFIPWLWLISSIYLLLDSSELISPFTTLISVIFIRYCLVSLKYGYFTQGSWDALKNKRLPKEEEKYLTLKGVWIRIPMRLVDRELCCAYKRQTIKRGEISLSYLNMTEKSKEKLLKSMNHPEIEDLTFPGMLISKYLVKKVNKRIKTYEELLILLISLLYGLLPGLILWYRGEVLDWYEIVYVVVSGVYSFLFCSQFLKVNLVGVYDFSRKKLLMAQCTSMISNVDNKYSFFEERPVLDMEDVKTILSWYYMRNAFLDFGRRFTLRVFLNTSLILPLCIGMIVIIILMTFNLIDRSYFYAFVPGIFLVFSTLFILCYMISSAILLNNYFAKHRDILLGHIANLLNKKSEGHSVRDGAISTLWVVVEKLNQDEKMNPVKVLGVKLDSVLFAKLTAVIILGFCALIRLVTI